MSAFVNNSKMYQRNIMTKPQQQMILQYMEKHPDLFRGRVTKEFTPQMKIEMWEELASLLNERGPCVKTTEKWRRAFIDWKCAVKKKAADIASAEKLGRPGCVKELNDDEMRLFNLINNAANAEIEAINETDEEIFTFPGIQISEVYSNCIPVMEEEPVQMNWEPPSEIASTNILDAQIKPEPTDSVKNLTDNMIGDGLIQKSEEPALANVLEAQVKLEQTDICDTNLTPIIHKITNENLVTNETLQKNLKPISDNALRNMSEAHVVLEQSGTLGENSEQVTYAVSSNRPNEKEPLQNLKHTLTTGYFKTHMKLRPVDSLKENSEKEAFEVANQNSSAKEPPLKKLKPASETVLTTALEKERENLHKMPQVMITNSKLQPPRKKVKSSSMAALQNVMEAQIKMGKQMDTLNENLEKMTNAITGLTKAITNSCQLIFAVLDKNYAIHNEN